MAKRYINKPYEQMTPEEQMLVAGFRKGDRLTVSGSLDMIVEGIHAGGFGVVAIGTNSYNSGRPEGFTKGERYVLKGIRGDINSESARANFADEAFQWVRLWPHPAITPAVSLTTIQNRLFLILDYQPGTVASRIGKVSQAQALQYAVQIATGLAFLHAPDDLLVPRGPIIHRDLKPNNVLIGKNGVAQITDFGLVKTIESALQGMEDPREYGQGVLQTTVAGTYPYMAPEQWTQAKITPAVDIFAFGVLLCELLTAGDHPWGWHQNWRDSTLMKHLAEQQSPRAISTGSAPWEQALTAVYRACLAPQPQDRPTSPALVAGLQDVVRQLGISPWVPVLIERTNPNIAERLSNLGATYDSMQHYDEAVNAYQHAIALKPSYTTAWYCLGTIYNSIQRYNEAVTALKKAIALNPSDAEAWHNLGNTYEKMQHYDEAVNAYQHAIALKPSLAVSWHNLGITYHSMQHYADAVAAYQRAIDLNPSDVNAWTNLGSTYKSMQRYDEAVVAYQRALDLNPSNADTWANLGAIYRRMQRYADAVVAFQRAIDLNPSYAEAWHNLGTTYVSMQRYDEAVVAFQRVIDLNPSYAEAWYNFSVITVLQGKLHASIQTIDAGLQHCPTDTSLYQLKYDILSKMLNRPEDATRVIAAARTHGVHLDN